MPLGGGTEALSESPKAHRVKNRRFLKQGGGRVLPDRR
jgi:hypothetical protein